MSARGARFRLQVVAGFVGLLVAGAAPGAPARSVLAAFPVLAGDPVDPVSGRAWPMLPGVPLLLPQPDGRYDPPIIDPTRVGDTDLVVRAAHLEPGPVMPPPVAVPPVATAGGTHLVAGSEIPFTVVVSDGGAGLGVPLAGPEMDGIPVIVAAFADLDGDGVVGPTAADAEGIADDGRELQESNFLVGRQVAVFSGGVAQGRLAVWKGAPASAGGLPVVLTALAYAGGFSPGFFAGNLPDGPGIATLLPFFPRLDPDRILDGDGRGGPASPNGRIGIELEPEFDPPVLHPVLGTPFALPTDGSGGTIDRALVVSGPFSRVRFVQPSLAGGYPVHEEAPLVRGAGGALLEPLRAVALADDGPGNAVQVQLVPVDALDQPTDPPPGTTAVLVASPGVRILAPDADGDPAREPVTLDTAAGVTLTLDDAGGPGDGPAASAVAAAHAGFPSDRIAVQLGPGTSGAPVIRGAAVAGRPAAIVVGCSASRTVVAVVEDPEGDRVTVRALVEANGAVLRSFGLAPAATPPGLALPAGPVYGARTRLRPAAAGTMTISIQAADEAGHASAPAAITFPVVAASPPRVSEVTLAASMVPLASRIRVGVTARAADDCRLARVTAEVDADRGFRRAGRLRDDGKGGDAVAGDGVFAGSAVFRAALPGTVRVRVVVRSGARETVASAPLPLVVTP